MGNSKTIMSGVTAMTMAASALAASVCLSASTAAPAEARSFTLRGPIGAEGGYRLQGINRSAAGIGGIAYGRGAAGARSRSFTGANGGSFSGGSAGAVSSNAGLVGHAWQGTGPNGGSGSGASAAGWQTDVGAFRASGTQLAGPNGSTYSGSRLGTYNSQTGQASLDQSRQAYDAANGQSYGYTKQSSFTPGQGVTKQVDTDNHGDYTVNWQQ